MQQALQAAAIHTQWTIQVKGRFCGVLSLLQSAGGFFWNWNEKPKDLVPLVGVLSDGVMERLDKTGVPLLPYQFYESDSAVDHILYCTGAAFGDCNLQAVN